MKNFIVKSFKGIVKSRKGASTVEYVTVLAAAALIGGVLVSNGGEIGNALKAKVSSVISSIDTTGKGGENKPEKPEKP
ncbi:Flp family type IVb pilin [Marininema halotolerans]|uniref:Pilus assembly protein Flp/PilA n=1 Tax=Marininema halotolerans TaxID=1155944 RepID=A0A1I6T9Q7_9BACL|nr:DUF4244 domain-containing protein [Marininema halotolerans]SFS85945.1 hypothetical protein SAMN05444972_109112 [Marininema halotolerans]